MAKPSRAEWFDKVCDRFSSWRLGRPADGKHCEAGVAKCGPFPATRSPQQIVDAREMNHVVSDCMESSDSMSANSAEDGSADERERLFDTISLTSYVEDSLADGDALSGYTCGSSDSTGRSMDDSSESFSIASSSGSMTASIQMGLYADSGQQLLLGTPQAVQPTHFAADTHCQQSPAPVLQVEEGWGGMVVLPRSIPRAPLAQQPQPLPSPPRFVQRRPARRRILSL